MAKRWHDNVAKRCDNVAKRWHENVANRIALCLECLTANLEVVGQGCSCTKQISCKKRSFVKMYVLCDNYFKTHKFLAFTVGDRKIPGS